eukprot:CAMPEP_0176221816 /NCGR_PEP_ID=MMETSP0121_2-20121125/19917_1 /TAXON_ID=160619 /ORGANISM="Kryptoperidinium foliaceum, Strain CCMP 1326" /LENGTH=316 /DNA_ID=CAMNT_0017561017 /DNA_START=81 /DNA_END=1031 /DNA_ORIENTATION=-
MSTVEQAPQPKRKLEDEKDEAAPTTSEPESKIQKLEGDEKTGMRPLKRGPISKAREIRLEQNRKAARESRRRKKVMIEELQRSVIFFSRANGTLKHQNDDLSRMLMQAQAQVAAIEGQQQPTNAPASQPAAPVKTEAPQQEQPQGSFQQAEANTVATQAVYESQGFPAAAARAAAQTMNGSTSGSNAQEATPATAPTPAASSGTSLPPMQPGATMQAMANFQQAAAAAMQAAVQGMQSIPGVSVQALTATAPAGANSQQAYNDTMTALAMQQAAAAAVGQQYFQQNPFMAPMMAWQGQQPAGQAQAPAPQPAPAQP